MICIPAEKDRPDEDRNDQKADACIGLKGLTFGASFASQPFVCRILSTGRVARWCGAAGWVER